MGRLLIKLLAGTLCVVALPSFADDTSLINEMNMKPLTPAQSAQLRAERDAAKAQWAKMTPEQREAIKKAAAGKKQGELSAIDRMGQNEDMMAMSKTETAQAKAAREAEKAKWDAMTPDQKNAIRKAAQQKRAAEMTEIERIGQNDDMNKYFTY